MRSTLIALSSLLLQGSLTAAQPANRPPGCASPEARQFDFWVGYWEVHPRAANKLVAHSLIEKRYAGCAIRENWMPLGQETSGGGGSLSSYDPGTAKWFQTWVDSQGSRVEFSGRFSNGTLTLTGLWRKFSNGRDALVNMHYRPAEAGSVRQWAEASSDGGKTWVPAFDFIYRPAIPPPALAAEHGKHGS